MAKKAPRTDRPSGSDGFVIVAVLWILGALATLASIYTVYVVNTATAFAVHDDRLQAEALVTAGLELTVHQVTSTPNARPSHGAFNFRLGNANVAVQFSSESARIDINQAPKELLAGLFAALGGQDPEAYADRVVAWRAAPQEAQQDTEADLYRSAGRNYVPRGAPFPNVGELWLVLGIPDVLVERALPFLTVYSGQAQINVLDAPPEVLAALPGMTPDRLNSILQQRAAAPQNGQLLLPLLGPAQAHGGAEASKTMRVQVRVDLDNGRRLSSEAIIYIGDGEPEPYRVLSWRDDIDQVVP